MIVDAHLHVWDLARAEYAWMDAGMGGLHRTVTLDEIAPALAARGVDAVVLVQSADERGDTELLLELAREHALVAGVVAYAPLDDPDALAADLEAFADDARVLGIRNLVHERPAAWFASDAVERGLAVLAEHRMPLDVPTDGFAALARVAEIAEAHPALPVVLDHLGKPPVGGGPEARAAWRAALAECARHPTVVAKLSGLYAASGPLDAWTVDDLRPIVDDALDLLGADRLLYGSDWPISLLAGGDARTWDAMQQLLAPLSASERAAILGGTAARVYRIPSEGAAS
ncbi:amidohydrolase family protein [Agrococcus versicolor]|uniref:Amidohydrolase family protein n=1 Tax=Agrococcus versicolor TaxID=501482 RepID=A0ABP5MRI9_9MICO